MRQTTFNRLRIFSSQRSLSVKASPAGVTQNINNSSNSKSNPNKNQAPLIKNVRKQLWDNYVSNGRGANILFETIDLNSNGFIEASELEIFIKEVLYPMDPKENMPYAWNRLNQRILIEKKEEEDKSSKKDDDDNDSSESAYDIRAFKKWLVAATKMSADTKNTRLFDLWEREDNTTGIIETMDSDTSTTTAATTTKLSTADNTSNTETSTYKYSWNEESMSQSVRRMQYAVRGEVVMKADQLASDGKEILYTNIGNPHQVGQSPITYYRQVLALCDLPAKNGVDHPHVSKLFPKDVVEKAREYRNIVGPSGTGAYTHSQGILGFRRHVANYITKRDGIQCQPSNIFLTNGASSGISMILQGLLASNRDAIMIPTPQYPIYSALIGKLGGRQVGYELDEDNNWSVSRDELEHQLDKAQNEQGLKVKALAMINPGNPSGNVMTYNDIRIITDFCTDHDIVMLADEVYQTNVYTSTAEFISAKKVACSSDSPSKDDSSKDLQLISFHSTSKGLIGECGRRGGYMELCNIDPYVQSQIYKLASADLCSGVVGQIMTSLMCNPPLPDDESYELYENETSNIFEGLKERSRKLVNGLNSIPGINCVPAEGAMYAFPSIQIPRKAIMKAKEMGTTPDNLYALSLLEETGICVVPASGFGQKKGRIGFRTTFLHPDTVKAVDKIKSHHEKFVKDYS